MALLCDAIKRDFSRQPEDTSIPYSRFFTSSDAHPSDKVSWYILPYYDTKPMRGEMRYSVV